jgi:hypothetical protein
MNDKRILPALILGLSIGWLVGLSVSEAVGGVIAALMGLVGGIGSGLAAWSKNRESLPLLNLWPMALLGLGIAVGASAGVYARGQQWLGNADSVNRDERAGSGVLYSLEERSCTEILVARRSGAGALRRALRVELGEIGAALDEAVTDDATIDRIAGELCAAD